VRPLSITACLALVMHTHAPASADDFTWTAQIGQRPSALVQSLSQFYNCWLHPVRFTIDDTGVFMKDADLQPWSRSTGNRFSSSQEEVESSSIQKVSCQLRMYSAGSASMPIVAGYVHQDSVFRITLNYNPICSSSLCRNSTFKDHEDILRNASSSYESIPDSSDFAAKAQFDERFVHFSEKSSTKELFHGLRTRCDGPRYFPRTTLKYRCFFAANIDGSSWYSIVGAEVETVPATWLKAASYVQVVFQQQFASLPQYEVARNAFAVEAEQAVQRIQAEQTSQQREDEQRKRLLGTTK